MKGSVVALTGTTLALALACAALIQQVQTERRRAQAEATLRHQWEDRFADLMRVRSTPQAGSSPPTKSASGAQKDHAAPLHREDGRRPPDPVSARFLDRLATPDGHAQLLTEAILDARRWHPDLAKALHLTDDEETQVLAAEAEQGLKLQARHARCRMDPACDEKSGVWTYGSENAINPVQDLLGAEKFSEYEQYKKSVPDRSQVREMRARLDAADVLSDEQAEKLVAALGDERERYETEARETGRSVSHWVFGSLMAAPQASGSGLPSDTEILNSAQDFVSRLRKRAADVLTDGQMRQFVAIQDEQMERLREMLWGQADYRPPSQ